jgi:predicted nucleic acid-binding protein
MMKVYLDTCCYNRPFDGQENILNRFETEAKLVVQQMIKDKRVEMVWSDVLDYENNDNPFEERCIKIADWRNLAIVIIEMNEEILERARNLMSLGLRQKDALHIACAIHAGASYFLTVDKKILNKPVNDIRLINPIDFLREEVNHD